MFQIVSKYFKLVFALLIVSGALTFTHAPGALAAKGVVVKTVEAPFDKIATNFRRQIAAHKLVIVKEVPYQQMLRMVGVKMGKAIGFEVFHPRFGKTIVSNDPSAMKDAPLRIVIREVGDKVIIEYREPSAVFAGYSGLTDLGKQMDKVFASIVERATK
jgi:uncharacterized protein (DUF302 family)